MKVLVLCVLLTAALGEAAPPDGLPADTPAIPASPTPLGAAEKTSPGTGAAATYHVVKVEPAAAGVVDVHSFHPHAVATADTKGKAESQDKKDATVEPVVELAEPSAPSGLDPITANSPVKTVPVFVPVEYAAAYRPDNFFSAHPVSSGLGGYVADPYRSVVRPWYHLVSPQVPLLTLYPGERDESFRAACAADPALRYIHNLAAAHPQVPYYKFPWVPDSVAHVAPSVDYSRSTLISSPPPAHRVTPFSPIPRVSPTYPYDSYIHPGSFNYNPYVRQISPVTPVRFYSTGGIHVPGQGQLIHV